MLNLEQQLACANVVGNVKDKSIGKGKRDGIKVNALNVLKTFFELFHCEKFSTENRQKKVILFLNINQICALSGGSFG